MSNTGLPQLVPKFKWHSWPNFLCREFSLKPVCVYWLDMIVHTCICMRTGHLKCSASLLVSHASTLRLSVIQGDTMTLYGWPNYDCLFIRLSICPSNAPILNAGSPRTYWFRLSSDGQEDKAEVTEIVFYLWRCRGVAKIACWGFVLIEQLKQLPCGCCSNNSLTSIADVWRWR